MKRVFGDFETNGLYRKPQTVQTSEGLQYVPGFIPSPESFAYIVTEGEGLEIQEAGVLYFYNPAIIEHKADAEAIHGLTEEFLSRYRADFTGNLRKLYKLFYRGNMVGHNFRGFDLKVGRDFLAKMGYGIDVPVNSVADTMFDTAKHYASIYSQREGKQYNSKRLKLSVLCQELNVSDNLIKVIHKKIFGYEPEQSWHSASWDTTATYLCYRMARSKKIME